MIDYLRFMIYDLRFTICDLRFTIYDLRVTIDDLRLMIYNSMLSIYEAWIFKSFNAKCAEKAQRVAEPFIAGPLCGTLRNPLLFSAVKISVIIANLTTLIDDI